MNEEKQSIYRIRIQGHLESSWSDRLGDMTITRAYTAQNQPITILIGTLVDQASLSGVLNTLHGLNCKLMTVENVSEGEYEDGGNLES